LSSRIFQPKDFPLWKTPLAGVIGVNGGNSIYFTIPTPSARVLAKVAFFYWIPTTGQGATAVSPNTAINFNQSSQLSPNTLQLWTAEQAETGWWINTGDLVGVTAVGGQNLPLIQLPIASSGLSLDIQGGQSGIGGVVNIASTVGYTVQNNGGGVTLSMRVRYELVGSDMCDDEWAALTNKMQISCPGPVVFT
jgi:hypothetical protein